MLSPDITNLFIMKNMQMIFVGLSFLAIGLVAGLLVTGGSFGTANVLDAGGQDEAPAFDPEALEFVSVSADDDTVLGDPNAPVTIIEFSDFQCPYCAKFVLETMPLLQENYIDTGLVKLIFRDYPLPSHADAAIASEAAECVGDELYYEMHDAIFGNISAWSGTDDVEGALVGMASELGVDIAACMANGEMTEEVAADYAAGRSYGVSGTPTFFINGKKLVGAWPYETFVQVIESEL
jgi:protein-disulfide isomerase